MGQETEAHRLSPRDPGLNFLSDKQVGEGSRYQCFSGPFGPRALGLSSSGSRWAPELRTSRAV